MVGGVSGQQPEEYDRHPGGRQPTKEQSQRTDAFLLENLRPLQNADAGGVGRVGDHGQLVALDRAGHERVLLIDVVERWQDRCESTGAGHGITS